MKLIADGLPLPLFRNTSDDRERFHTLSLFVAQYEEYRPHLVQHLVDRKIVHWDDTSVSGIHYYPYWYLMYFDLMMRKSLFLICVISLLTF